MSRLLFALIAVAFVSSLCFAQGPVASAPAAPAAAAHAPVKAAEPAGTTLVGKVESVSLADLAKGIKSEIVVVDGANKKTSFLIKATTTIYDAKAASMTLDKIKAGDTVKVKYQTSKEGVEEAVWVRIIS